MGGRGCLGRLVLRAVAAPQPRASGTDRDAASTRLEQGVAQAPLVGEFPERLPVGSERGRTTHGALCGGSVGRSPKRRNNAAS